MHKHTISTWITVILSIFIISACSSPEEKRNTFMENGKRLEQQGDLVKARLEYKNAVQVDPNCVECLRQLGKVELELKNLRGAYAAIAKAAELDPDDLDIKIDLGRILIMGRAANLAEKTARDILEKSPDNLDGKVILVLSYALKDDTRNKALEELATIRKEHPERPEGYVLAARILASRKKFNDAVKILESAIDHVKSKAPVYETLMEIYSRTGKWDKAIEYAKLYYGSVKNGTSSFAYHVTLSQLYEKKGELDAAGKEWEKVLTMVPEKNEFVIRYAHFLTKHGNITKAEKLLREKLAVHPEDVRLRVALSNLLATTRRGDEAISLVQEGNNDNLEKPLRLTLIDQEATINFRLGRFERALALTDEVLKENPNDLTALSLQAKIALIKRDGEQAVSILRRLVEDEPDNINYMMLLAQAHALNHEFKLAENQLRTIIKKHPENLQTWEALIKLKLAQNDIEGASTTISEALGHLPDSAQLYNLSGMILWRANDVKGAEEKFKKAMELSPEWLIPYRNLAALKLQEGNAAEAQKTFEEAAKLYPEAPGPKILLATLFEQTGRADKAIVLYEELLKKHPKSTILMNNLAFLLADTDNTPSNIEKARSLIDKALEKYETPPTTFLDTKAWIAFREGKMEEAMEIINQALALEPDNPTLLYHQAEILAATGKVKEAVDTVKKALEQGEYSFAERKKAEALLKRLQTN